MGALTFVDSEDTNDSVHVDVTTSYWSRQALERSKVCTLKKGDGKNGIGFFVRMKTGNETPHRNESLIDAGSKEWRRLLGSSPV